MQIYVENKEHMYKIEQLECTKRSQQPDWK